MKKTFIKAILFLITVSIFGSCTREVEDLFDRSSAQRLADAMSDIEKMLTNAPNGWEMRYYIRPEAPGYAMLVDFNADGSVKLAAKNATTRNRYLVDEKSTWGVIGDNGPVVTFNTFNEVMHVFSDPNPDGVGRGGDYEFIVLEWAENRLKLKGKKNEAYFEMFALEPETVWEEYFTKIDEFNAIVFTKNNGTLFDFSNGQDVKEATYSGNTFYMPDDDGVMLPYSFIVLPDRIQFYSGIATPTGLARNFTLNADHTALICMDETAKDASFKAGETAAEYCKSYLDRGHQQYWTLNLNTMSPSAQTVYNQFADAVKATGATISKIILNKADTADIYPYIYLVTYRVNRVEQIGKWYGELEATENTVRFVYKNADANGSSLLNRAANSNQEVAKAMIFDNLLGKELTVTSNAVGTLNYSVLRFSDGNDSDFYFTMSK